MESSDESIFRKHIADARKKLGKISGSKGSLVGTIFDTLQDNIIKQLKNARRQHNNTVENARKKT